MVKCKKYLLMLALLVMLIPFSILLSGCTQPNYVGEWKLSYIKMGEEKFEIGELTEGIVVSEDFLTLNIKSDGTFSMSTLLGGEIEFNGTWEKSNGKAILTAEDQSVEVLIVKGILIFAFVDAEGEYGLVRA